MLTVIAKCECSLSIMNEERVLGLGHVRCRIIRLAGHTTTEIRHSTHE